MTVHNWHGHSQCSDSVIIISWSFESSCTYGIDA